MARFKRPQIISSASADLCVTLGDSFNLYFFLYKRGNNFFCEGFFPFFLAQVYSLKNVSAVNFVQDTIPGKFRYIFT